MQNNHDIICINYIIFIANQYVLSSHLEFLQNVFTLKTNNLFDVFRDHTLLSLESSLSLSSSSSAYNSYKVESAAFKHQFYSLIILLTNSAKQFTPDSGISHLAFHFKKEAVTAVGNDSVSPFEYNMKLSQHPYLLVRNYYLFFCQL